MARTYRKITTGEGYGISVLARTKPNGRESRYKEISALLGAKARTIAMRIVKSGSRQVHKNGNQPTVSHVH
jgi:hypothetical protein